VRVRPSVFCLEFCANELGGEESLCPGRPVLGVPGEVFSGGLSLPANVTLVAANFTVKGSPELHGQTTGIGLARHVGRPAKGGSGAG
jgi:hypothetical protein